MNKNQIIPVLILTILFTLGLIFIPLDFNFSQISGSGNTQIINPPKKSLQLKTIKFSKPKKILCPVDYTLNGGITCVTANSCSTCPPGEFQIECKFDKCIKEKQNGFSLSNAKPKDPGDQTCTPGGLGDTFCPGCKHEHGIICFGKPVILLYPEKPTLVDVEVATSGEIYISDPLYPTGGWKNVLANPDGSLVYQNKNYEELFYESKVKNYGTPPTGLVFKTSELENKLPELLYKLGLNNNENEIPEFMDFWLPKLQEINSKYMYVSLIEKEVKVKNDNVIINPEPVTRIEIIVYFKPLERSIPVKPLTLGNRPERHGFTMVEWGGTIDPD